MYFRAKCFYKFILCNAAQSIVCSIHADIIQLIQVTEHTYLRKLGHSGQENKTKITVSALQDTVERFQYFPILIQQVLIQDRLKQWLVILINQHNNLLSCLHACLLYHVSKTLFRTTVFLLLTIEQLPFLQILIKHSRQVSSSFIFPGIQVKM